MDEAFSFPFCFAYALTDSTIDGVRHAQFLLASLRIAVCPVALGDLLDGGELETAGYSDPLAFGTNYKHGLAGPASRAAAILVNSSEF
jgi:hypothetical protein